MNFPADNSTQTNTALATKANQLTTYTKIETDTLLSQKEDILIAGEPVNGFLFSVVKESGV